MRALPGFLLRLLLVNMLVSWPALAGIGIGLDVTRQYSFLNCSGSAAQTVPGGQYLVTITGEDTWECSSDSASTCTSGTGGGVGNIGAVRLPLGTVFIQSIGAGGRSVSCFSSGSTGNIVFTRAG